MIGKEVATLALRGAIGGTMIAHGIKHARTLEGTGRWFDSIGFRQIGFRRAREQAIASAAVEIGSGAALLAGATTPLSASAVVGGRSLRPRSSSTSRQREAEGRGAGCS